MGGCRAIRVILLACVMLSSCAQMGADRHQSALHNASGTVTKASSASKSLTMFHSPLCGCCSEWASHAQAHGFQVKRVHALNMSAIKSQYQVPLTARSCHTTVHAQDKGAFVFEGHVPAYLIERFLASPPNNALGLAVPGMPVGSAGMERGRRHDDYSVLLLLRDGSTELYERVTQPR